MMKNILISHPTETFTIGKKNYIKIEKMYVLI